MGEGKRAAELDAEGFRLRRLLAPGLVRPGTVTAQGTALSVAHE